MTPETRGEIVRHAIRWALNILVEVQGNHGSFISTELRYHLKQAITHLSEAEAVRALALEPAPLPPPTDAPGRGWPPDPRRKKR